MPRKKGESSRSNSEKPIEKKLVENLVSLQKVHVDLAEKFDKLAKEISQLLALFETTAKTFTKNAPIGEYEKDKDFLNKIDRLLEQNKVLAKGLTLMEEHLRERMYGVEPKYPEPTIEKELGPSPSPSKLPPRF